MSWMTPWFIAQFLAVPLSMALHICDRQREALALQIFGLLLRVGMVFAAATWQPNRVAEAYAISGAVFYLIYLVLVLRVTGTRYSTVRGELLAGLPTTLIWCSAAIVTGLLLSLDVWP